MKTHTIIIDNKKVFVSQSKNSFKVIKPWRNEDGSINWFNALTGGSWWNLILVGFIVFVILGLLNEYNANINMLMDCFRVPGQLEVCKEAFGSSTMNIIIP